MTTRFFLLLKVGAFERKVLLVEDSFIVTVDLASGDVLGQTLSTDYFFFTGNGNVLFSRKRSGVCPEDVFLSFFLDLTIWQRKFDLFLDHIKTRFIIYCWGFRPSTPMPS